MDRTIAVRCPHCKNHFGLYIDALGVYVLADVPDNKGTSTGPMGRVSQSDKYLSEYSSKTRGGRILQQNAEQHRDAMYPPNMPRTRRLEDK